MVVNNYGPSLCLLAIPQLDKPTTGGAENVLGSSFKSAYMYLYSAQSSTKSDSLLTATLIWLERVR